MAKEAVIGQLSAGNVPVATVVAPAGYGKTTLLARWAQADPRPFAWVALDGRDDDPVVLLRYIAAAIHRVEPVRPGGVRRVVRPEGHPPGRRASRVSGSALAARERPLVLAFDDLHAVSNPSCLDVLGELSRYVPAGSQIAVTSRQEPPLPLGRWRAQGSVTEIGVADLRLDEQEARLLLEAAGVELDDGELSELTERTEGWPAGLYLAALSMQAGAAATVSADGFTGGDRFVSQYFHDELLSRLPEAEAKFLRRTSILERMRGALCDAVLGTTGSAPMLETLAQGNGFVVPLDRRGEWYRYHHLFGELLRNDLDRTEPEVVPELNARAMAWCIANDLPEEAIGYGQAAGETDTVAGLVDALSPPLYYDGRLQTLEEWLGWFDDDQLAHYPTLAVFGAWWRALTGRAEEAERWLALADGAVSKIPLSDGSATIEPWVATLRAHMMPNGVEQALADADLALDQLAPESFWIPTALLARGVAHALLGATDRAVVELLATVERGLATGSVEEVFLAQALLALLAAKEGAWGEAARRARAAEGARRRVGPRRLLDERSRARRNGACRAPRGTAGGCSRSAGTCSPHAAHAQPQHSMGNRGRRDRAHAHPSRTRRRSRRPHDARRDRGRARAPPRPGLARRGRARASRPPRCDLRLGRCLGDEPHGRRASAASLSRHPPHRS